MPIDPNKHALNDPGVDCSPIEQYLHALPAEAMRGLLTALPGFDEVIKEIIDNQAVWGEEAGITSKDFASFQHSCDLIDQTDMYLPVARMIVQKLESTRAVEEDKRQRTARAIAEGVERRAKNSDKGDTMLAQYQKTRAYRSANGIKAYKTRLQNEKLAQQQLAAQAQTEPFALPEGRPTDP